jgi:type VI secretion system secreted protein VgrG
MPSRALGSSKAGAGEGTGSARAAGSGVGSAAAGAALILGCGAPNIIVDRAASPGLTAAFAPAAEIGGGAGGTRFIADSPNTIVAPEPGAGAGFEGADPFFAGGGDEGGGDEGRFAVGNIMVRPAASSEVGGTGDGGERGGLPGGAGCGGGFAGGGTGLETGGAAKIAVVFG